MRIVRSNCWALHGFLDPASGSDKRQGGRDSFLIAAINILLYRQSQRSNWMQKQISLLLLYHRCPKAVFSVFHRCGLCLSYTASLDALRDLSSGALRKLEIWKEDNEDLMAVVDNINFRIVASEEVSTNRNQVVNATIGLVTRIRIPNPIPTTDDNRPQLLTATDLRPYFYKQTDAEWKAARDVVIQLLGRVLADHIPELGFLKPMVSQPLTHPHSEWTSQPTDIQGTEILFLDENKSDDIPLILDYFSVSIFFFFFFVLFFLILFPFFALSIK